MSAHKKTNSRRKGAAVALAVLGVAGLSLASAAQLQLNGTSQDLVQAGTVSLNADICQATEIDVTFTLTGGAPGSMPSGSFGYVSGADAILLSSIDSDCAGKTLKVALGDADGDLVGTEFDDLAAAGPLTLDLNGTDAAFGDALSEAQIDSISQISVTIY